MACQALPILAAVFIGTVTMDPTTQGDCADFKERCIDSQTRTYCVDGQTLLEPCPSMLPKCDETTGQCIKESEDIICDPETHPKKCLDEKFLRVCHHGTVQVVECQDPWPHCNNKTNSCSLDDAICFDSIPQCRSETEVELCNALGTKEISQCSPGTYCHLGVCVEGSPCLLYEISSTCINDTTIKYCTNTVVEYADCTGDEPFCDPDLNKCTKDCDPEPICLNTTSLKLCENDTRQLIHCKEPAPFCDPERKSCSECLESTCLNDSALSHCNDGKLEQTHCQDPTPLCRNGACTDSKVCSREDYYTSCVNSSTLLICFNGLKDYTVCSEPHPYCDREKGSCTVPPLGFECPSVDGYYPDLKSCDTYHFCGDGKSTQYNCSTIAPGSLYDPNIKGCSLKAQHKKCHRFGCNGKFTNKYRVYRGDRSVYGLCSKTHSVIALYKCPEFQEFNETEQNCQARSYECRKEGRIPDGGGGYFDCVMSLEGNRTFIRSPGKCPDRFYYSETYSACRKLTFCAPWRAFS